LIQLKNLLLLLSLTISLHADVTPNQLKVQEQLHSITQPTQQEVLMIGELGKLDLKKLQHSLNQISGEQYTSLSISNELINTHFLRSLYNPIRLTVIKEPCPYACYSQLPVAAIWIQGGGGQNFINNCKHVRETLSNNYLLSAGAHIIYDCDWTIGLAAAYGKNWLDYREDGRGNSKGGFGAVYGLYRPLGYYVFVDLVYGTQQSKITRRIAINDLRYDVFSRPKANSLFGYVETGMDCPLWNLLVQPFFGLESDGIFCNRIKECGKSPLNLIVSNHNFGNVFSRLGTHITMDQSCFLLSLDLVWKYRLNPANHKIRVRFQSFGNEFHIKDVKRGQSYFEGAFAILTPSCKGFNAYAEVSGFVGYHSSSYQALAGISLSW
jgi:outer membrane autotransporter protein